MIGLVLVSGAVSFGGILLSEQVRRTSRQRGAFLNLLYFIRANISLGSLPLQEIYERFEDKTLESIGFISLLRKKQPDSLSLAIQSASGILLTGKEKKDYLAFARQLGRTGSAHNEETLCQRYIELLEKTAESENARDEVRAKLYRRLAPVAGLFLAVVLI